MNEVLAKLLSTWWCPPEPEFITAWLNPDLCNTVLELWQHNHLPEENKLQALFSDLNKEKDQIRFEYERLFVGPGHVPCPPYEALWQANRPKHEGGMVTGQATDMVRGLYADLGLRVQPHIRELPDHVAIEFEALALALETEQAPSKIYQFLVEHLEKWIPLLCASVMEHTELNYYRTLASLTLICVNTWSEQSKREFQTLEVDT